MNPMQEIQATRRINLWTLLAEYGNGAKLAKALGMTQSYITQLASGHRQMGERAARKIEQAKGLPAYWMDSL